MKITTIDKVTSYIVETDESYWSTYRRNGPKSWEQLMGDSWESCYTNEQELEMLFQEAIQPSVAQPG